MNGNHEFDAWKNGGWPGAGIPVRVTAPGGAETVALLDLPESPEGELVPVLLTMLFGRTKEDLGAIAEAFMAQGRFAVFRPAFLNSGDEAPGNLADLILGGSEIAGWGAYLRSEAFRSLCRTLKPGVRISQKAACLAASITAPQALDAQAETGVFDALAFLSFIPDVKDFLPRKTGRDFEDWLALEWRYRFRTAKDPSRLWNEVEGKGPFTLQEEIERYGRIREARHAAPKASLSDFNVVVDGVPSNLRKAFSEALDGLWDYRWDLGHMLERARRVPLPLTFIAGGRDDYYPAERLDEFIVRSREGGLVRRYIRIEDADHRMRPYPCFERAMEAVIRHLLEDLGFEGEPVPFSAARIAVRRLFEARGFALRHAKTAGVPVELAQKLLLRKEDLRNGMDELFGRSGEVAEYARLLDRSRMYLDGGSILEELEPERLMKITSGAIEPRHYRSIAEGIARCPETAGSLFPAAQTASIEPRHFDGIFQELTDWPEAALRFLATVEPELLERIGRSRAGEQAARALRQVPALREFAGPAQTFDGLPLASKSSFIAKYPLEARCIGGRLPREGVIDESSGSSGVPTHWVRCREEEDRLAGGLKVLYRHLFGPAEGPMIFINGFSQGAWATATKLAVLSRYSTLSKNIGTDPGKILSTLEQFGPAYTYNLAGYPPFLRELVRTGVMRPGFRWQDYRIHILHGGEGYTPAWRRAMRAALGPESRIVSSYGASDLDLGIAYETPLAQAIRELLELEPRYRHALLGSERLPVFFGQYNPAEFWLEEIPQPDGRYSIAGTVTNPLAHQPRVRYDTGDDGRLLSWRELAAFCRDQEAGIPFEGSLRFPFVALYGRLDGTISLDGANVTPPQVEEAIYSSPRLTELVGGFRIRRAERSDGTVRFEIDLETYTPPSPGFPDEASALIAENLSGLNGDYRESLGANPGTAIPEVRVVEPGTLGIGRTIKNRYIE